MSRPTDYEVGIAALRERGDEPLDEDMLRDVQRRVRLAIADGRSPAPARRPLFALVAAMAVAAIASGVVLLRQRPATVDTPDGAHIVLDGETRYTSARDGRFALENGRVEVSVVKQAPGHRVELGLGDASIIVHGTRFVMEAKDGRGVAVEVSEGIVEVALADTPSILLHAGERWTRSPLPTTLPEPAPPSEPTRAPPAVVAHPRPAPVQTKKQKVDLRAAAEKAMARRDCDETHVLVGRYVAETSDTADAARVSMLEAECWVRANDKARALPVLDRIAKDYAGAPGAQSALFEAATTRAELKQAVEAVAGFDVYLARYPKGTFAEAAAFRRCELLGQLNGHASGAACLDAFVTRFPNGRRMGDALLLSGSLACADERYSDATKAFWSYLDQVRPERDDTANLESLLRCLERGRVADAPRAREAFTKRAQQESSSHNPR